MKINNRRKVCAGVLALGLFALALDRTVFSAPDAGEAALATPAPAVRASIVGGEALDRGLAVLSVGQRLDEYRKTREGAGIADAFAAVGGWFERSAQKQPPAAEPLINEFKLGSISDSVATVNGTALKLGQEAEVAIRQGETVLRRVVVKLVSVDARERVAVIESDGQLIELKAERARELEKAMRVRQASPAVE